MIHHQDHIFLGQFIKTAVASVNVSQDTASQFVIHLDSAFLIRLSGVTVKHPGSKFAGFGISLYRSRIGELTSVISEYNGKELQEQMLSLTTEE